MGTEGRFIMQAAVVKSRVDGKYQNSSYLCRPIAAEERKLKFVRKFREIHILQTIDRISAFKAEKTSKKYRFFRKMS